MFNLLYSCNFCLDHDEVRQSHSPTLPRFHDSPEHSHKNRSHEVLYVTCQRFSVDYVRDPSHEQIVGQISANLPIAIGDEMNHL